MKDKIEGTTDEWKGKMKEEVGKATGDKGTEWSGKMDEAKGKVKEGVGEAKQAWQKKEEEEKPKT